MASRDSGQRMGTARSDSQLRFKPLQFKPQIRANIQGLKESATLAINIRAKQLRAGGKEVFHFGFGESPFPIYEPIQQALRDNAHRKEYLPTHGLPALRQAIADFYREHYGYDFDSNNIAVGPGTKELLFQALLILEGPLLIPSPSWVSYGPQAQIAGKEVHILETKREDAYKLSGSDLEKTCLSLKPGQKILLINSPNNPTGAVYSDEEIAELSEVCRKHQVIVISDEIYGMVRYEGKPSAGFSSTYPEGTIVTSGMSKFLSAGGYRLGFLAAPASFGDFMNRLGAVISETFSAVSAPIQHAALRAYQGDQGTLKYVDACTHVHAAVGTYTYERLVEMGLGCAKPEGGFYVFPDFDRFAETLREKGILSSSHLAEVLLDEWQVAALPGEDFYQNPDRFALRMAFVDYDGASVLEASIGNELGKEFVETHCPNVKCGLDQLEKFVSELRKLARVSHSSGDAVHSHEKGLEQTV